MGTTGEASNERLRTVWTPEMDRYFIDLMLEQVRKGNRFDDHLFSKRAWKHMSSLFNAKFKFPYGKDVLKNRHKTLRNLHRTVKNLLGQNGFSWDGRRQMVTADNGVWEEYLKVHPDARSFRIKSIPCYNDLCLIYGDGNTEQKGTTVALTRPNTSINGATELLNEMTESEAYRICDSMIVDDNPNAISIPKGTVRARTSWHPPMDRYFIDLMMDHVRRGHQIEGVFRKQAWMEMIASFNTKFGFDYDVDVLKNRYKTLKRQHNVLKNLLQLDGFSWDDARQMVTADDCVWQDYIKAHTDARQFMTRPVPYYKDLCVICNDTTFDENDCFVDMDWFDPDNDFPELTPQGALNNCQSLAPPSFSAKDETLASDSKSKRQPETGTNPKSSKKPRGDETVTAVSSYLAIEKAVEAVQALPDMNEELILDACDLLEDETKAKTFLALDVKLRKKWLLRKLRSQVS